MELKQKQTSMINDLLEHTISLRKRIEETKDRVSHRDGYMKTLVDIEKALSAQPLDINRLRRDKFGIFRMVDGFAESSIEREMMALHDEIFELLKVSKDLQSQHK